MNKLLVVALVVVVLGGVLFYFAPLSVPAPQQAEEEQEGVRSVAGRVTELMIHDNAFRMIQETEDGFEEYVVRIGENSKITRVTISDEERVAKPERIEISLDEVLRGSHVFVHSADFIWPDQEIVNPLEVEILE